MRYSPFHGQKGQDTWVAFTVLPFKRRGFFLDLAAADGTTESNTYGLEKLLGWSGICVEPNPVFFERLSACRSCTCDPSVVSDKCEQVAFRVDNGQLGGIVADDTDNNERVRGDELNTAEVIRLDAITLTDLLDRHRAPAVIDYFSLDVEGAEERVVAGLDFSKYRFLCVTIERPTPKVNQTLFDNGYVFVKNRRFDSFYVHSSLAGLKRLRRRPFAQVPPKEW